MKKFPKIFTLGHRAIENVWSGEVEVTEKIDGSQFRFYKDEKGFVHTYSKESEIFHPTTDKLFQPAVDYINSIKDSISLGFYFYGETLCRPKHNVLTYNRVPRNHIALFGVYDEKKGIFEDYKTTHDHADNLDVDIVPVIGDKTITAETAINLLDLESYLGGPKIEGFVVRNVYRAVDFHGIIFPMMIGKFVSEVFKEKLDKDWKKKGSKNTWQEFMERYRTEAHWQKSFQHLREDGKLIFEPKDIGLLIKESQEDLIEECKDEICEFLWKTFGKDLLRHSIKGLPEWYKEKLLKGDF